jgi:hypothetical protein
MNSSNPLLADKCNDRHSAHPSAQPHFSWLVLFVWLLGSLATLFAFEYQAALRGLICAG